MVAAEAGVRLMGHSYKSNKQKYYNSAMIITSIAVRENQR